MGLNPSTFSYKEVLSNKATIMMMMLIMMVIMMVMMMMMMMMMMIVMVVVMMVVVLMMRDSSRQTRNARTATVAAYPQDFESRCWFKCSTRF